MWREFREFAMRGNVVDLAVGIILGAAFTTIVNSLVNDIIMPPLGLLIGGIDFSDFFVTIKGGNFDTLGCGNGGARPSFSEGVTCPNDVLGTSMGNEVDCCKLRRGLHVFSTSLTS